MNHNKDEKAAASMYKVIAEDYHASRNSEKGVGRFYNESIEVPGMLKMLGNIKGKKILDWGCGSGIYIKRLKAKCNEIKGFDISPEMVKIAKEANPEIEIKVGSGNAIPFNEKFDIVFASLSLHYLKDLNKAFSEIVRVLKPKGELIFSTSNPYTKSGKGTTMNGKEYKILGIKDYFKLEKTEIPWTASNGKKTIIFTYLMKNKQIFSLAYKYGFDIVDFSEPAPLKKSKKNFPLEYELYSKVPIFSIWKLRKR